jgi:hypothetical protein
MLQQVLADPGGERMGEEERRGLTPVLCSCQSLWGVQARHGDAICPGGGLCGIGKLWQRTVILCRVDHLIPTVLRNNPRRLVVFIRAENMTEKIQTAYCSPCGSAGEAEMVAHLSPATRKRYRSVFYRFRDWFTAAEHRRRNWRISTPLPWWATAVGSKRPVAPVRSTPIWSEKRSWGNWLVEGNHLTPIRRCASLLTAARRLL